MKKVLYAIICFALAGTNVYSQKAEPSKIEDNPMPFQRVFFLGTERTLSFYQAMPIKDHCIMFVGNSITAGCDWSELFNNSNIINRGIDGNITLQVLARTDELIRHKPSKMFLKIGINDLGVGFPIDTIVNNIHKIIQRFIIESPKTKIYIQSVLPVNSSIVAGMVNQKNADVLVLNEKLKVLAAENGIAYIDLHSHFLAEDGVNLNPKLTNDGIHLIGQGYLLWKSLIVDCVNE
jgi:lysophospholipase L1-like esterase